MITLNLPGGMALQFYEPDGEADAKALLQYVQMAIAPFKVIFDAVETFSAIQDVLNAAVTDPLNISSEVDKFLKKVVNLLQYIPQLSAVGVLRGGLQITDGIMAEMEDILTQVELVVTKKAEVEAAVDLDPALADIIPVLDAQITERLAGLQLLSDGLAPVSLVLSIIGKLIGLNLAIPSFSCDSIANTRDGITSTRRLIARLLNNL